MPPKPILQPMGETDVTVTVSDARNSPPRLDDAIKEHTEAVAQQIGFQIKLEEAEKTLCSATQARDALLIRVQHEGHKKDRALQKIVAAIRADAEARTDA